MNAGRSAAPDSEPPVADDPAARWLLSWTGLLSGHKWILAAILIVGAAVFSGFSAWITWQPDILAFFSAASPEVKNVQEIAAKPGLANQLRFDVHCDETAVPDEQAAVATAAGDLAAALSATGQFRSVWRGVDAGDLATAYNHLASQAPLLLSDEDRVEIAGRLSPEYLRQRFADVRAHLADPDGELLLRQLAADPLDLGGFVNVRLSSLAPATGGEAAVFRDGLLMRQDAGGRWHAMIVTEPISLPSDQKAAPATLDAADAAIARVARDHPGVGVWVVGAHRGYVENTRRIIRDVSWISAIGSLAVAAAIALYFRRVSAALLCMIPPIVGVGLALGLAGLFQVTLPLLLLGFAGLLCGSTTDYGIQIIAECRRLVVSQGLQWQAGIPAIAARRLLGPISMSVATSITGFSALALSSSPGLRALGLFVAAATVCIWLVTFLVLPACLGPWILPRREQAKACTPCLRGGTAWRWIGPWVFLGVTAYLTIGALHVRFNSDPRSLDGSPQSLRDAEDAFAKVWGDPRNHAIVLITKPNAQEALAALARVNDYLDDQKRDGLVAQITSPAIILPDQTTVQERAASWAAFWTAARRGQLRDALAAAATANGFKPEGFTRYADQIGTFAPESASERLASSPAALFPGFIERSSTGVTLASIVRMRDGLSPRRATAWGPELRIRFPSVAILGGNMLFFDATERARAEGERLLPWCTLAILLPVLVYFRRLGRAWLVMLCLIVGLLWVLGAAAWFAGGLNLLSLVPMLFTLGVAIDYGIYLATDPALGWRPAKTPPPARLPARSESRLASTGLCALTTILGSGSLALASHPALRWLGITLVAGVAGGFLAAAFLVCPMMRWTLRPASGTRFLRVASLAALNLILVLLTLALIAPIAGEIIMAREKPAGVNPARAYPPLRQTARRQLDVGDSSMRWRGTPEGGGIWEIRLVGDPFERGNAVAQLAAPLDHRIETEMLDQLDEFLPEEWSRWLVLRGMGLNLLSLPKYVPLEYQQEIYASATAGPDAHGYLAPGYPRVLAYHALHDVSQMLIDNPLIVPKDSGCTGVVSLPQFSGNAAGGGHLWLARNFDFEGGDSFGRQKSLTFVIPPAGEGIPFAHVAWPGLAGCITGMNSQRIAVFLNAAATGDFARIGTPTIFMARDILEHASSIEDAARIIRRTQTFVSDIIVVADGKTGRARIFEKSPAATASYDVQDSAAVANHLITPRFARDPVNVQRIAEGTTMQRFARARELLDQMKGDVGAGRLAGLLRDKKGPAGENIGLGNRNAIDGLIACHAVIMDVSEGKMWIAAWPYAEGTFIGVDILGALKSSGGEEWRGATVPDISADPLMHDGQWQRVLESRTAEVAAAQALAAGDFAAARRFAVTAIRENPNFYLGHELRGRAFLLSGNKSAAKEEFQKALDLDPPYAARRKEVENLLRLCGG